MIATHISGLDPSIFIIWVKLIAQSSSAQAISA